MAKAKTKAKKKVAKKKVIVKKQSVGRPTKYSLAIVKEVERYIDSCEDEVKELVSGYTRTGTELYREKLVVKLPSIEGLSRFIKISVSTIQEWQKLYPEFSLVIRDLLAKQAEVLLNKGLSGDYSAVIAKVLLTKHGYREGIENSGKDGGAIEVTIDEYQRIDKLIDEL